MSRILLTMTLACLAAAVSAAPFNPDWGTVGVFSDANICGTCHRASTDQDPGIDTVMRYPLIDTGEDVSPSHQWQHSVMAHAFNDPYYQAKVEDEAAIFSGLAGFIEDKCLTCHAPMARTHAHQAGVDLTLDASCPLPDGCYRLDTAAVQDHAREGVSCTLCHQIKVDNLGGSTSFSGGYLVAASGDADALRIYGPHANPVTGAMTGNTQYTPFFGNQVTDSAHCATCHTLYTPTVDADNGTPTGNDFLEQAAYLEWQNSVYFTGKPAAQQCQDCHMPEPEAGIYSTRTAIQPNGTVNTGWPVRSPFFTHSMTGGNTYLLELLRDNRAALEIDGTTTTAGFDAKIADTRQMLQTATADVNITRAQVVDDELEVDVETSNRTGHKFPTGFPSRRAWLHVTVRDADNQVIFESGAVDAAGRISTDSSRLAPDCLAVTKPQDFSTDSCYEPHRDVINDASRVAIYETVMGDTNGDITHVLLHSNSYLKDNRIPPRGFTGTQAGTIEPKTLPAGIGSDSDFNTSNSVEGSGSDVVHYRVSLGEQNGPYNVDVRLLYQAIQPAFVDSMQSGAQRVASFKAMAQQNTPTVETIASSSAVSTASGGSGSSSSGGGGCSLDSATAGSQHWPLLPTGFGVYLVLRLLGLLLPFGRHISGNADAKA